TGALAPNTHAMVGRLYSEHSPRRDSGYAFFYTGILVGALVGPLVTGFLQTDFGFHIGFGAAAVGMLFGLISYFLGRNTVPAEARIVPNPIGSAGRIESSPIPSDPQAESRPSALPPSSSPSSQSSSASA
ncbi:MFS transporter, partial [Geobacillus sp. MMMUD3]|nr:MFS transporter [Geobacillus sp. MMMUD3]